MSPGDNTQLYLENANARREAELAREQRDEARLRAERERRKREELEAQLLQEKSILEATRAAHKRQEANNEEFREHLIENQGAEEVLRKEEEGKRVAMENAMLQQRARIERLQEEIETKRKAEEEKKAKAKAETARALQELEEKYKTDETGLDFDDSVLRVDELELAPFLPPSAIPQLPPSVVAASVPPVIVSALDSRTPRNIAAEDQESLKLSQEAPFLSQKARVEDRPVPTDRPLPQSINSPAVAPVSPPNNEIRLPYSPKASPLLRGGVRPAAQDDSPEPRYKPARRGAAPTMSYMVPAGAKMTYGNGQQFVHADPATFYRLTKPKSVQAPPRSPAAASAAAPGVKANPTSASARKKP